MSRPNWSLLALGPCRLKGERSSARQPASSGPDAQTEQRLRHPRHRPLLRPRQHPGDITSRASPLRTALVGRSLQLLPAIIGSAFVSMVLLLSSGWCSLL